MKKTIAVFDFDGTLTTRDTLLQFIRYACGSLRFYAIFALYSPMIALMFMGIIPNWRCKVRIFSTFFRGTLYTEFQKMGVAFREPLRSILRPQTMQGLLWHLRQGHQVYVVSASMAEWVYVPLDGGKAYEKHTEGSAEELPSVTYLCTQPEVVDGRLTGRFASPNCYGPEKVNRLLAALPDLMEHRDDYYVYAYGDSNGDREMLQFADEGTMVK